jgi:hypothetical protein
LFGSFDEFAGLEDGAGADECDEVGCVHCSPASLGGLDELERHCCVAEWWAGSAAVASQSDGECEFGESRWKSTLQIDLEAEFVVAAGDVLHERMSGGDHLCAAELFEAAHWP